MLESKGHKSASAISKKIILAIVLFGAGLSLLQAEVIHSWSETVNPFWQLFLLALLFNFMLSALLLFILKKMVMGPRSLQSFMEKIEEMQDEIKKSQNEHEMINRELNLLNVELNSINKELEKNVDIKTRIILEQRKKLEYSSRMSSLGEMAGGIAHEINNPLMIIKTALMHLKKTIGEKEAEGVKASVYLEKIDNTIDRISKIIQGLLSISIDTTNEVYSTFSLKDVFDDVLKLTGEKFKVLNVDLRIYYDKEEHAFDLCGKRILYTQIFFNLLNFYADQLAKADVRWIALNVSSQEKKLVIKISDSLNGPPAEIQEKILQSSFSTQEFAEGADLGNYASLSLVKELDGDFHFEANEGKNFLVLTFPLDMDYSLKLRPELFVR